MPAPTPTIYLIGGCNGAGKTTFAREFLPKEVKCLRFLNADEIARGLSPLAPAAAAVKAARLLLEEFRTCVRKRQPSPWKAPSVAAPTSACCAMPNRTATGSNSTTSGWPSRPKPSPASANGFAKVVTRFLWPTSAGASVGAWSAWLPTICRWPTTGRSVTTQEVRPMSWPLPATMLFKT